jgi:hypothetical protein
VTLGLVGTSAPLDDDPLGVGRSGLDVEVPNAAAAEVLSPLLSGDVATGWARVALHRGFTARGLARRFEGSGLHVEIESRHGSTDALVARVAGRAEKAGLPVDRSSLETRALALRVWPEPA